MPRQTVWITDEDLKWMRRKFGKRCNLSGVVAAAITTLQESLDEFPGLEAKVEEMERTFRALSRIAEDPKSPEEAVEPASKAGRSR